MNEVFSIGQSSMRGLAADLVCGNYSVEKDLALVNANDHSGRWTLINTRKEGVLGGCTIIKGKKLHRLMVSVANNTGDIPKTFQGNTLQALTKNFKFRCFCRILPDFEDPKHQATRERGLRALNRAFESVKIIGRGLASIESRGRQGRHVGQDRLRHTYWLKEIVFREEPKSSREIEILTQAWKQDEQSPLSLQEWEAAKKTEWKKSARKTKFLHWLATDARNAEEKKAWETAHPQVEFSPHKLVAWAESQIDPEILLPLWKIQKLAWKADEHDVSKYREVIIDFRRKKWTKLRQSTGLEISFDDFVKLRVQHMYSGSTDFQERWILRKLWKQSSSGDDFITYAKKTLWQYEAKSGLTNVFYDKWMISQARAAYDRYIGSKLPLSYEVWNGQQNDDPTLRVQPFVLLDDEQRKIYHAKCDQGIIERNAHPFDTKHEKTAHSGYGYAIFVIGPGDDLYVGSHIRDVFHHSSFLGLGAVLGAGEIKTTSSGQVIELSSKSGHYRPRDVHNLYMLRYFQARGVDLASTKFTHYDRHSNTVESTALEYMITLERGNGRGN